MLNCCANPTCKKPLHYLREGRIFIFEVPTNTVTPEGKKHRAIEHYWLCGDCDPLMLLEHSDRSGVSVRMRKNVANPPISMPVTLAS